MEGGRGESEGVGLLSVRYLVTVMVHNDASSAWEMMDGKNSSLRLPSENVLFIYNIPFFDLNQTFSFL